MPLKSGSSSENSRTVENADAARFTGLELHTLFEKFDLERSPFPPVTELRTVERGHLRNGVGIAAGEIGRELGLRHGLSPLGVLAAREMARSNPLRA